MNGRDRRQQLGLSSGLPALWATLIAAVFATLVTLYMAQTVGQQTAHPPTDSDWYRAMANGQTVIKPFANRVLAPFLAHTLARVTRYSNDTGYYILGLASLWSAVCGVLLPVLRRRQALGFAPALFLMFFWQDLFRNYFLPDLLHAALLVIFFSLLATRRWTAAAMLLPPLYLARESTLLLSLIAVPVLWHLLGRRIGLLFSVASLAGMGVSKFASRHGLPNIHHLNDTLYMLAKVPWNFSRNVLGVTLWTNADVDQQVPAHIWQVPSSLHLGGIHQLGFYPPSSLVPLSSFMILLILFGLGPCVMVCLLSRVPLRVLLPDDEPYLWVAALYGGVAYLLAPSLGTSLFRLVGYGWPLFLIYLPAMMPRVWTRWHPWQGFCLLAAHLLPCWLLVSGAVHGLLPPVLVTLLADGTGIFLLLRAPVYLPLDSQATPSANRVYDKLPKTLGKKISER